MYKTIYQHAARGELEKIKYLIEVKNIYFNEASESLNMRAIDFAALHCRLEIIQYLLSKNAVQESNNYALENNILFCICAGSKNKDKQKEILRWLLETNNFQKLALGLEEEHILAALGEAPTQYLGKRDKSGFLPVHYAAMVNNENVLAWCSTDGKLEEEGEESQGVTVSWILTINENWSALTSYVARYQAMDFNAAPVSLLPYLMITQPEKINGEYIFLPEQAISSSWSLAINRLDLLKFYLSLNPKIKINFAAFCANESLLKYLNEKQEYALIETIVSAFNEEDLIEVIKQLMVLGKLLQKDLVPTYRLDKDGFPFYINYVIDYCYLIIAQKNQTLFNHLEEITIEYDLEEKRILKEKECEELQEQRLKHYLEKIFTNLCNIKPNSNFYTVAQNTMGSFLLSCLSKPQLHKIICSILKDDFEYPVSKFSSDENKLRLQMLICLMRGESKYLKQSLEQRAKLYEEVQVLKNKIQNLKLQNDTKSAKEKELEQENNELTLIETKEEAETLFQNVEPLVKAEFLTDIENEEESPLLNFSFDSLYDFGFLFDDEFSVEVFENFLQENGLNAHTRLSKDKDKIPLLNLAALFGFTQVVNYLLYQRHEFNNEIIQYFDNFLFCACIGFEEKELNQVLIKLLENNFFEKLGLGINKEHIAAALGEPVATNNIFCRDKMGFLPCHYAALVGNEHLIDWCPLDGAAEENRDLIQGNVVSLLLAKSGHFNLLADYILKFGHTINPNTINENGETFLLLLALAEEWEILDDYCQQYKEHIDFTLIVSSGDLEGINLLWLFAFNKKMELFNKYAIYAKQIDWNVAPANDLTYVFKSKLKERDVSNFYDMNRYHNYQGATLAWLLIKENEIEFISTYLKNHVDGSLELCKGIKNTEGKLITLFDLLGNHGYKCEDLLKTCLERNSQPISISFLLENIYEQLSRLELLVFKYYYSMLFIILKKHNEENIKEVLTAFESTEQKSDSLSPFVIIPEACQLALAEKYHIALLQTLSVFDQKKHEEKSEEGASFNNFFEDKISKLLILIFESFDKIKQDSVYHEEMLHEKGNVILNLLNESELVPLLWEILGDTIKRELFKEQENNEKECWSNITRSETLLRLYMEYCLNESEKNPYRSSKNLGSSLVIQLISEALSNKEKLEEEYKQICENNELSAQLTSDKKDRTSVGESLSFLIWEREPGPSLVEPQNQIEANTRSSLNNN